LLVSGHQTTKHEKGVVYIISIIFGFTPKTTEKGNTMKLFKTATGFEIRNGDKTMVLADADMRRFYSKVSFIETTRKNLGHDVVRQLALTEIFNEGAKNEGQI
jgi:hypothetical protein